jgi:DNA modification methylase
MKPYYEEPGITIYHGDCRDILPHLEPVDLVLTSPPYDGLRDYGGHPFDWKTTIDAIVPDVKEGGICVWVVGDETKNGSESCNSFRQAIYFTEVGLKLYDTMIYLKNSCPFPSLDRYNQIFEYMFVFTNGKPKTFTPLKRKNNYGSFTRSMTHRNKDGSMGDTTVTHSETSNFGNVWLYDVGYMKSSKDVCAFDQPATFLERLAHDHIYSWSCPDDTILDPMMGSGTTIKVAKQLGRKAIGIEIEQKYCDIAIERLRQGILL